MISDLEFQSKEAILTYQVKAFRVALDYVMEHSTFYKKHFSSIQNIDTLTLNEIAKLPLTTKEDLNKSNMDFLCVPQSEVVDYVTTSGTTGEPVFIGLTDKDLDRLALNEAMSFECSGVQKGELIQLMTTIDRRFMAGIAYFLGARKLGTGIIRVGAGNPELQWDSILKFKPKHLIAVPSFLLKMIDYAEKHKIDFKNSSIESVICIGEPIRNEDFTKNRLHEKITSQWPINLYSTYASTEMGTAFAECKSQKGGHQHPELIISEILDDNNQPVEEGDIGELTITTLQTEGMPLIRFKTGDLIRAHKTACDCGRNSMRLSPVIGRKKQMIKYKGTTIYPPAMYDLLNDFSEIEHSIIKIEHNDIGLDTITLELYSPVFSNDLEESHKATFPSKN